MSQCWSANHTCRPKFENIKIAINAELDDWAASVVDDCDFMTTTNEGGDVNEEIKNVEKIKARRKSVFKIRARKDGGSQLDIDTRLAKPEVGVTERKHDNNIV
jgi:hypothetical protein